MSGRTAGPSARVVIAPVQAVLQQTPSPEMLEQSTLLLRKGIAKPPEDIAPWLVDRGFQAVRRVLGAGAIGCLCSWPSR